MKSINKQSFKKYLEQYFAFIRRFIPPQQVSSGVGLDIGAGDCKLVEILPNDKGGYTLVNWAIETVVDLDTKSALSGMQKKLMDQTSAQATALFGKGTLIRYIKMPRMPLDDLRKSFAIESDKYFPFAQDEIFTDCYILDPQGTSKQMSVMAAAAKRDLVEERVALLDELQIHSQFLSLNPIALANVYATLFYDQAEKDQCVAVFDIGDSISNLTILINGQPYFTRDVFIGGTHFSKRISNALGITFEDAEGLKKNPGAKADQMIKSYGSALQNMVQELKLSFDYFITEHSREIHKVFITGGGSLLIGLKEALTEQLDMPVESWNPLEKVTFSESLDEAQLKKYAPRLGVALGLALYHYDKN